MLCLFAFGCGQAGPPAFSPDHPSARFISLEGEVHYKKTEAANWTAAGIEQMLYPANVVRALAEGAKKGTAVLGFIDNSRLTLDPGSSVHIRKIAKNAQHQSLYDITVEVVSGLTLFEVEHAGKKREFLVETETALAAVSGTIFSVEVQADGATRVVVKEGQVDVTGRGRTVSVGPSMETRVRRDTPPSPPVTVNLLREPVFNRPVRDTGTLRR